MFKILDNCEKKNKFYRILEKCDKICYNETVTEISWKKLHNSACLGKNFLYRVTILVRGPFPFF